jgi:hypothetical protein
MAPNGYFGNPGLTQTKPFLAVFRWFRGIIGGAIWGIFAGLFAFRGSLKPGQYFRNPRLRQIGDIVTQLRISVESNGAPARPENRRLVCAALR